MQHRYDEGHAHVRQVLGSPRYFRLLDALDALGQAPPWTERAKAAARKVLLKRDDREWKRLDLSATAAKHADSDADRDALLHEVRKSAKRLRYACEVLAPVFRSPAAHLAEAAENLQKTLGDHQDSVVSQQLLRELASHTTFAGDDALIYGRLHLLEQTHAERARAQYKSALKQVRARRPKRWHKT
jgi:CHAD domain-containing protein